MRHFWRQVALLLFGVYVFVYPGSLALVALDRVPAWGEFMGGVLLILQGAIMLAWLLWAYARRGAFIALVIVALAAVVELVGETTGWPFGRYQYTEKLQPQLFGIVPLAICCAWLTVVPTSYEVTKRFAPANWPDWARLTLVATLVLALDLQIETVAAYVNDYWVWIDQGSYYGVPTTNFIAWWLVGLIMALVIRALDPQPYRVVEAQDSRWAHMVVSIPLALFLMSVGMFTVINLARGYPLAGLIGVGVLLGITGAVRWNRSGAAIGVGARQTVD